MLSFDDNEVNWPKYLYQQYPVLSMAWQNAIESREAYYIIQLKRVDESWVQNLEDKSVRNLTAKGNNHNIFTINLFIWTIVKVYGHAGFQHPAD